MTNRAIFLDRDGTINIDKGYTYKIEDLKIIPGVVEGLKKVRKEGYKVVIVTNQAGIGRGYYTKEDYFNFRNELIKRLNKQGLTISAEYFCPHVSEDHCNCRKPKIGMLEEAARELQLDLKKCWIIGDSSRDIQAGKRAGCRTIQILTGEQKEPVVSPNFIARNMIEAADYILLEDKNK